MGSDKTAISQRWEREFQEDVKDTAGKYGTTMTQLTIEALEVMIELGKIDGFRKLNEGERKEIVIKASKEYIEKNIPTDQFETVNTEGLNEIGLIRDKVEHLLKINARYEFSTNDIADLLQIPQSTARTYVRDIYETDQESYTLVRGRPNKIYFNKA